MAKRNANTILSFSDVLPFIKENRRGMWTNPKEKTRSFEQQCQIGARYFWDFFHYRHSKQPNIRMLWSIIRDMAGRGAFELPKHDVPNGYVMGFLNEMERLIELAEKPPSVIGEGELWNQDGTLKAKGAH